MDEIKQQEVSADVEAEKAQETGFDPKSIGDEEFGKIFEDPRLWNHTRFKELAEKAKKAEVYDALKQKEHEEKLLSEKKFEELLAEKEAKIADLLQGTKRANLNAKIVSKAMALGAVDAETVLKLMDMGQLDKDDLSDEEITASVASLLDSKPFLKSERAVKLGVGSNPADGDSIRQKRIKYSDTQNAAYYRANEQAILEAMRSGNIEMDVQL